MVVNLDGSFGLGSFGGGGLSWRKTTLGTNNPWALCNKLTVSNLGILPSVLWHVDYHVCDIVIFYFTYSLIICIQSTIASVSMTLPSQFSPSPP